MAYKTMILLFLLFLPSKLHCLNPKPWIQAGYWYSGSELPISNINSALFTHLICAFAGINSTTYQLSINSSYEQPFSTFTEIVKHKNPSVTTLLSIWAGKGDSSIFSSTINQSSYRKSFIDSSINTARLYGFQGLDLAGVVPSMSTNMTNLGTLFDEWRDAISSESNNSGKSQLLLVVTVYYFPAIESVSYPLDSMKKNLDWIHLKAYDYYLPKKDNVTSAHAALYGPPGSTNTDYGIMEWLRRGFPASKLVLGLPYHGYAWTLAIPQDHVADGALASGPATANDGFMAYKAVKSFIQNYGYGSVPVYNSTYVANYFITGLTWINFDDVEAIKAKISYAKEKRLLGYNVFHVSNDNNWVLSRAAQGEDEDEHKKRRLLLIILVTIAIVIPLVTAMMCYLQRIVLKMQGILQTFKPLAKQKIKISATENLDSNDPSLQVFSFSTIKAATNNFSSENKLGEGGFGPVYKGELPEGLEIAVKRLSKTSNQGLEEFKNEVKLTARLQHVNLVRVLGFCTEREEKMLIYEYMPNKSLDFYLFDPLKRSLLDWRKLVRIIEGVTQGLLYLQEYSNFTIIHRDIKGSNILLDSDMNPKISDFGMARLFRKDEFEASTGRIVGTYGYIPPEYVRRGIYSMKYDVYSFGVLLLQIISGKRNTCLYGSYKNLNLLEFAYELWKDGKGMEFIDSSLDDSSSSCRLMRCMQVALLCVQENPVDRPSMLEVFTMLKNETVAIKNPKQPAFSVKTDEDNESSILRGKNCSVNYVTMSQVVPRS